MANLDILTGFANEVDPSTATHPMMLGPHFCPAAKRCQAQQAHAHLCKISYPAALHGAPEIELAAASCLHA